MLCTRMGWNVWKLRSFSVNSKMFFSQSVEADVIYLLLSAEGSISEEMVAETNSQVWNHRCPKCGHVESMRDER